jgi:hypothetical protein
MALLSVRKSSIRSPLVTRQWPTAISYHLLLKTRPTTAIYDNQLRFSWDPWSAFSQSLATDSCRKTAGIRISGRSRTTTEPTEGVSRTTLLVDAAGSSVVFICTAVCRSSRRSGTIHSNRLPLQMTVDLISYCSMCKYLQKFTKFVLKSAVTTVKAMQMNLLTI